MSRRLRLSASICLLVIYGLAGLTGRSLHYLVEGQERVEAEAPTAAAAPAEETTAAGYGHFHGPDFHWHRHGPSTASKSHSTSSASSASAHATQRESSGGSSSTTENDDRQKLVDFFRIHDPHTCPLLTLIVTLQQGQGEICQPVCRAHDVARLVGRTVQTATSLHLGSQSARGPPAPAFS